MAAVPTRRSYRLPTRMSTLPYLTLPVSLNSNADNAAQLSNTSASLVWSTTPALAAAIKALPLELLPQLINAAYSLPYDSLSPFLALLTSTPAPSPTDLSSVLAGLTQSNNTTASYDLNTTPDDLPPLVTCVQPSTVASFPLRLSHADSYLGMPANGRDLRTALVGDAAHTIHPLAGQGLNMGLGDIQALVKTLEQTVADGGDVGESLSSPPPSPRARTNPLLELQDPTPPSVPTPVPATSLLTLLLPCRPRRLGALHWS
jgi:ubiquinone biosynthesis monooxygenase Coq6